MKGNSQTNFYTCTVCGRTNEVPEPVEEYCGGCLPMEGHVIVPEEKPNGAGGVIVDQGHWCERHRVLIDISLVSVIVLICVTGTAIAILKNRKRKNSNKRMHRTSL